MANSSEHTVKLSADFSDFVRNANKAGKKSAEAIGKAIEAGVSSHSVQAYQKANKIYEKLTRASVKEMAQYESNLKTKLSGETEQKLRNSIKNIAKLTQELQDITLDDDARKRKRAEKKSFQEKCKNLSKLSDTSEKDIKTQMAALMSSMRKADKEHKSDDQRASRRMKANTELLRVQNKLAHVFKGELVSGASELNSGLESALTKFKDGISNIDIGSMISGGASALGKGLGGAAESLEALGGAGGALGGLASALGGVALVLGPLVIAFGLFAGVMFGIDKEVKEFNKTAINAFGTRSVFALGGGNIEAGLTTLRHATQDLNKTLGLTSEEAMGVFDALDAGGISLNRLTKGAAAGAAQEKVLGEVLRQTASAAKALGVGVSEFTSHLAEYANETANSLESVTDQFAQVSKQALDAGFSTRRFYSLITQAASGQASLNTHLSTTGDLLIKMAKAIGDKAAAEMIGGASASFKDMSTQDRYKTIMTTGAGRTKDILKGSAERQASTFTADLKALGKNSELAKSLKMARDAGVTLSPEALADVSGEKLVKELASMTTAQQSTLMSSLTSSSDKTVSDLGRRLDQLTTVSRGTTGSMADMSTALGGLDPGAAIAMKLSSAMAILGRPLDELTGVDRMAAESITGLTGSQMEQYQALARVSKGNFALLENTADDMKTMSKTDREALQADQDTRFGAHMDENGKVVTKSGAEIANAMELMSSTVAASPDEIKDIKNENTVLAEDALDETMTISDVLQNEITQYLRGIYEDVGLPLLDIIEDMMGTSEAKRARHETTAFKKSLARSTRESMGEKRTAERTISTLERKTDRTEEEDAELEHARGTVAVADARIAAADEARTKIEGGVDEAGNAIAPDLSALADTFDYYLEGSDRAYSTEEEARAAMTPEQSANESSNIGPGMFGGGEYITKSAAHHTSGSVAAGGLLDSAETAAVRRIMADRAAAAEATGAPGAPVVVPPTTTTAPTTAPTVPGTSAPTTVPTPAKSTAEEIIGRPRAEMTLTERMAADVIESGGAPAPIKLDRSLEHFGEVSGGVMGPMAEGMADLDKEAAVEDASALAKEDAEKALKATGDGTKAVVKALTKDVKLGNSLARSNLPDAIGVAIIKAQTIHDIEALALAAGLSPEDTAKTVSEFMEKGTVSGGLQKALGDLPETSKRALDTLSGGLGVNLGSAGVQGGPSAAPIYGSGRRFGTGASAEAPDPDSAVADSDVTTPGVEDFLYRGDGVRGTITPIDTADDVIGMKRGGAIDRATGGSGGSVTVNIYGGDERRVFDVVKRVLSQSGIGPGRVTSRA